MQLFTKEITIQTDQHANDDSIIPQKEHINHAQQLHICRSLQKRLNISELLDTLTQIINVLSPFDSLSFHSEHHRLQYIFGNPQRYKETHEVHIDSHLIGTIQFTRQQPFTQKEKETQHEIIELASYPLQHAITHHQTLEQLHLDHLTKIENRAAYDHALQREIRLASRQGLPFCLIAIDIDRFKRINDLYGHNIGDAVIKTVAEEMQGAIRQTDGLYRFGGEEFTLLLRHTTIEGAKVLGQRILERVAASNRHKKYCNETITVSLGITQFQSEDDARTLFERADQALYQAKNAGRNRLKIA